MSENIIIIVECVSCDSIRKITAGETNSGEQPMCNICMMPMVATKAEGVSNE